LIVAAKAYAIRVSSAILLRVTAILPWGCVSVPWPSPGMRVGD
jgi:hypothetical protein